MSGISKRVSGSWVSGSYGIMKTATDTITTLPADLYADGNSATVGLVGNMSQTGTPTPQNPIQPQETGDRTENLFDKTSVTNGYYINPSTGDAESSFSSRNITDYIDISNNNGHLYLSSNNANYGAFYDTTKTYISGITNYGDKEIPDNAKYVRFTVGNTYLNDFMAVISSTAPSSYIPYGYKIPISSANTTTPVYLGEVETTRKVKKLVLTGEEDWGRIALSDGSAFYTDIAMPAVSTQNIDIYCTHYKASMTNDNYVIRIPNAANRVLIIHKEIATITDFKAYLAQQYTNNTPVVVYYVLATPTTGIVNEPLRKIGDYADTVSGITIPTIAGADSFDVLTTLKPSEVSANYHGWHTGTVHERESGSWD